jgi:hypothetical protein
MKKKMALNDGESNIHGCQRFSFIPAPRWSIAEAAWAAPDGFNFYFLFRCGGSLDILFCGHWGMPLELDHILSGLRLDRA